MPSRRKPKAKRDSARYILGDWRGDWLYALVLREAEETWEQRKREMQTIDYKGDKSYWQYVLVEEYGDSEDSMCCGDVLRAWTVNNDGLSEISLEEDALHHKEIRSRIYPFILIQFHVHLNRKYVVLGHTEATTAGSGCVYRVEGKESEAKLVPDESFGFWIS